MFNNYKQDDYKPRMIPCNLFILTSFCNFSIYLAFLEHVIFTVQKEKCSWKLFLFTGFQVTSRQYSREGWERFKDVNTVFYSSTLHWNLFKAVTYFMIDYLLILNDPWTVFGILFIDRLLNAYWVDIFSFSF
jgi:hypothetical protein